MVVVPTMAFIRWIHGQAAWGKHRLVSLEKDVELADGSTLVLYVDGLWACYHPGILDSYRDDYGVGWSRF